jgi:outer membrane protein OmpA-like peptidoglycan-associated protein
MRYTCVKVSAAITIAAGVAGCGFPQQRVVDRGPAGQELRLDAIRSHESERGLVFTIPDVLFEEGKADLRIDAKRELLAIATSLKEHPNQRVLIEGHTDSTGSSPRNHELSLRRSTMVETFFLKQGIDPERIEVRGRGEEQPIASNATVAGRQQNRRVEIVMLNGDGVRSSAAVPSRRAPAGGRSSR